MLGLLLKKSLFDEVQSFVDGKETHSLSAAGHTGQAIFLVRELFVQ